MPHDSPYSYNRKTNLISGFPSIKSKRQKYAMEMAFNASDRARRERVDAANHGMLLDHIEAIEETIDALQLYVDSIRRPVRDGVALTAAEAVELIDVAEPARTLTIGARQAFCATGSGPFDRHRDLMRHRKCTTSTRGELDPESQ